MNQDIMSLINSNKEAAADISKYVIKIDQLKFDKVIGTGGFGEVSVGVHIPSGLKVAIKKIYAVENNPRNKELYQREIENLANLKHRFLLPFIGYTDIAPFCIITKFIPNGSLYNALHITKVELSPTELTMIAYGISSGMQFLHSHKIIHRDLKTQNVLLDEHSLPVIADFGSSRKQETERAMTGSFGTTNYMAPEFIQGEDYNEKVDVYSFGLILWEMLTNKVPFSGLESAQVIYTVVIQQSRPTIPEDTPPNLAKLIECCWSPNVSERPSFEQITPLFENGTVEFPDCDCQLFNNLLNTFSPQIKLMRRHSNSNLSLNMTMGDEISNIQMSRDDRNIKSFANLLPPKTFAANITQRANEFLYALNSNNNNRIRQALDFFESLVSDPNILSLSVWPQFLLFVCAEHPIELIKRAESLCLRFAKTYELLNGISQVADLAQFVKPNTLDLFLYVVNFVPNIVDNSIVKALFSLFDDQTCSEKAITLVCRIVQNSPQPSMTKLILARFKEDALKYVDTVGGYLIVRTLVFYNYIQCDVITAFSQSKLPENIISAYHALFAIKGQPELFSLSQILTHITNNPEDMRNNITRRNIPNSNNLCDNNDNSNGNNPNYNNNENNRINTTYSCVNSSASLSEALRNEALEFIRRYAAGADGEPLLRLVLALFEAAIKYESEKAALLLVRVASDPQKCVYIFKVGVVDQWLAAKPKVAVNLLKLFIASINSDERAKFMFQHPLAPTFFTNVLRAGDDDAAVAVCWTLLKGQISLNFANSLLKAEFVSILCDLMSARPQLQQTKDFDASKDNIIIKNNSDNSVNSNNNNNNNNNNNLADPKRYVHFLNVITALAPFVYHQKFNYIVGVLLKMINEKSSISYNCIVALAALSTHTQTHATIIDSNFIAVLNRYNDNGESKKYQHKIFDNLKKGGLINLP